MDKIRAIPNVDFAGAKYISFVEPDEPPPELPRELFIIHLCSRDGVALKLVFSGTIQFSYKVGEKVCELYVISKESKVLDEAVSFYYQKEIPKNHQLKLFELEDINNFPIFQIIAQSVVVIKEEG